MLLWLWCPAPCLHFLEARPDADWVEGTRPVSTSIFEIARRFQINALILGLEERFTAISTKDCTSAANCLADLQLSRTFTAWPSYSFLAFSPSEDYTERFREKKRRIDTLLQQKKYAKVDISTSNHSVRLVLYRLLQTLELKAAISSKIQGNISLHLKDADAMEVLFYILHFQRLSMENTDAGLAIRPQPGMGRFEE